MNVLYFAVAVLLSQAPGAKFDRPPAGEVALAKLLDGRVAGEPVSCIRLPTIRSTEVIDGTAIVYRVAGTRRLYVNRPRAGADILDRDDMLILRPSIASLCRVDSVDLVERYSQVNKGFVLLGDFIPYDLSSESRR